MQAKLQSRIFGAAKLTLAGAVMAGFLLFTGAPSLRAAPMTIVRSAFPGPTIVSMKLLSIMDARAVRPITLAVNSTKPARIATPATIVGGMKTGTVGAPSATGMITITIDMIANIRPAIFADLQFMRGAA